MNEQKRRPLFLIAFSIPLRLQNPTLNLPFRTIEVEVFSRIKDLTLQLLLGKLRELGYSKRLSVEALGVVIPGIV